MKGNFHSLVQKKNKKGVVLFFVYIFQLTHSNQLDVVRLFTFYFSILAERHNTLFIPLYFLPILSCAFVSLSPASLWSFRTISWTAPHPLPFLFSSIDDFIIGASKINKKPFRVCLNTPPCDPSTHSHPVWVSLGELVSNIYDETIQATPSISPPLSVSFPRCIKWHWSYRRYLCSHLSGHLSFYPSNHRKKDGSLRAFMWYCWQAKVVREAHKNRKRHLRLCLWTCHRAEL